MSLTSYKYNGIELNNGQFFYVPADGLALDDLNTADATFLYRGGASTPVSAGISVKESAFTLNLHIVPQSSDSGKKAVVSALRKIFQTTDSTFYKLERKRSSDSDYYYLLVRPVALNIDALSLRASVNFVCADREWKSTNTLSASQLLFDTGLTSETMAITYNGNLPANPVLKLTPKTPSTSGPVPLYSRVVYAFIHGGRANDTPINLMSSWDTSALVSASKMRSDGLDITVRYLPQAGTSYEVPRAVFGTASSRSVWTKPSSLQENKPAYLTQYLNSGNATYAVTTSDTQIYAEVPSTALTPYIAYQNGYFKIDNEIIWYGDISISKKVNTYDTYIVWFKNCTRGQLGTTAANHLSNTPVLMQHIFFVCYGYSTGYEYMQPNNLSGWPNINYMSSTNAQFVQSDPHIDGMTNNWDIVPGWSMSGKTKSVLAAVASGDIYFSPFLSTGDGRTFQRAVFTLPSMKSRRVTSINLNFTIGTVANTTLNVYEVYGNYGSFYNEQRRRIFSVVPASGSSFSTGNLALKYPTVEDYIGTGQTTATHIVIELASSSGAGDYDGGIVLTSATLNLDETTNRCVSTYVTTTEQGPGTSQFGINVNVLNTSDPQGKTLTFTKSLVSVDQSVTIDCDTKTVVGSYIGLTDINYLNPVWLRLVPGVNNIVFSSQTGTGQVLAELTWKENY